MDHGLSSKLIKSEPEEAMDFESNEADQQSNIVIKTEEVDIIDVCVSELDGSAGPSWMKG